MKQNCFVCKDKRICFGILVQVPQFNIFSAKHFVIDCFGLNMGTSFKPKELHGTPRKSRRTPWILKLHPINPLFTLVWFIIHFALDLKFFLGHLSESSDLLLWVRVVCRASSVVRCPLTSPPQKLLGQSLLNLVCGICRGRRPTIVNVMTPQP